jgi:hypothetical protein
MRRFPGGLLRLDLSRPQYICLDADREFLPRDRPPKGLTIARCRRHSITGVSPQAHIVSGLVKSRLQHRQLNRYRRRATRNGANLNRPTMGLDHAIANR